MFVMPMRCSHSTALLNGKKIDTKKEKEKRFQSSCMSYYWWLCSWWSKSAPSLLHYLGEKGGGKFIVQFAMLLMVMFLMTTMCFNTITYGSFFFLPPSRAVDWFIDVLDDKMCSQSTVPLWGTKKKKKTHIWLYWNWWLCSWWPRCAPSLLPY